MRRSVFNKVLAMAITLVITLSAIAVFPVTAMAKTQQQATDWARSKEGVFIDIPGSGYGAQCVDLIMAYYDFLIGRHVNGNAINYRTNALPDGWQRFNNTATFVPQSGDIFVSVGVDAQYGHIGIVLSSDVNNATIIDQNYVNWNLSNGSAGVIHDISWTGAYSPYCFIRPAYDNAPTPTPPPPKPYNAINIVSGGKYKGVSLKPGERLNAGEYIMSVDRKFVAIMQGDGNFVVYNTDQPLWSTGTDIKGGSFFGFHGDDGNLVVYTSDIKPVWSSNTVNANTKELIMQNDGNLVAYDSSGKPVWASGSNNGGGAGVFYPTRADNVGEDFYALIKNGTSVLTSDNGVAKWQAEKRDKSQILRFQRQSDNSYKISAVSDNKCLDVGGAGTEEKVQIQFYNSNNTNAQRWRIESNGSSYMFGPLCAPLRVLDANANFPNGGQVYTWSRNDTPAQWLGIQKIANVEEYLNPVVPKPTVSSISIATQPTKTSYTVGDTLDTAGLTLTVNYSDNTKETITSGFTCDPMLLSIIGTQPISVTYEGKTAAFTVEVTETSGGSQTGGNSTAGLLNGIVLTATVTEAGVKFDFTPSDNPLGYRIYRSKYSSDEGISITDFPITAKDGPYAGQYVDVNIEPNTQYYYTIREVTAEAGFNRDVVEIIPEQLGPVSEELPVFTNLVTDQPPIGDGIDGAGIKKNFILMTIGLDTMLVNDDVKEIDPGRSTAPIIQDGRTLTPIRAIIEEMRGNVGWEVAESKVTLEAYENTLEMWIGSKRLLRNGEDKEMDIAPAVINERTMLPLRFVSDNVGCEIAWIGSSQQIIIVFYTVENKITE